MSRPLQPYFLVQSTNLATGVVRYRPLHVHVPLQGQCFIAIDPEAFAPGFAGRMQDMMDICRRQETVRFSKSHIAIYAHKIIFTSYILLHTVVLYTCMQA